jgi:hypothetical protein
MNGRCQAARVVRFMGFVGLALPVAFAAPATVSTADLARCAGMAAADARLACYDALAGRAPTPPQARQQATPAGASTFGLTKPLPQAAPAGPELIKALVAKVTESRFGNVNVLLDNGQTWIVDAPDAQLKPGDSVTIKRAALGSFLMMTPARRSYRVRRME